MKHKTIETAATTEVYNLVKIGGNSCIDCLCTKRNLYFDEKREIVELLHKYGYDVLNKNDQSFKEKLDSYNRVLELQAKKAGLSSYARYDIEELCVCGDYMFSERSYDVEVEKETEIQDLRGGKREGAGRKSKHKDLMHTETTTIRVPKFYKKDIKELIDFIFEKEPGKPDLKNAFHKAYMEVVVKANKYEDEDLKRSAEFLQDLWEKLPFIIREKQEQKKIHNQVTSQRANKSSL